MSKLPNQYLEPGHVQRVCSLYKKALRTLEAWYDRRHIFRYRAVLLRARFDKASCHDVGQAAEILAKGERELFEKQHFCMRRFANSYGGCAYEREVVPPDWVLDYWHPLEKAQYPEYFAWREERKKEFVKMWEYKYNSDCS